MEVNKEKIRYFSQFFFDKGKNANQAAEIVNGVHCADTVTRGEPVQTVAKQGIAVRKVLLCICWDWKGIIYYELLPYGQTLNSDLYCQQLDRLKLAIDKKRPELANRRGVVFHQDNARLHSSRVTRQKLWELG
ncbi:mariner transposase [Trichonephila clavipes]|uniref:Mariner transposase n=1 Tax=Trichonephila clavipes TaxID=2585209 RepID=A0A8X6VCJ0_TRICX|nr:mariner transposase [Trichonephila clavipes]